MPLERYLLTWPFKLLRYCSTDAARQALRDEFLEDRPYRQRAMGLGVPWSLISGR